MIIINPNRISYFSHTDIADNVTVVASTNSLEIKNNLADVNLTCWINGIDTVKDITISGMSGEVVDRVSPNTTYSVDCVEVDEEGQYQCMEYNGTVTTCELHGDNNNPDLKCSSDQVFGPYRWVFIVIAIYCR